MGLIVGAVSAVFLVVYGGASAVGGALVPWRLRVHLDAELGIPFIPAWALAYLSMNALVLLPVFVLRTRQAMWPYAAAMIAETVIGGVCFVLLPVKLGFGERSVPGWERAFFGVADTLNMEGNYLPSLHVAFALTAAMVIAARTGRAVGAVMYGWAAVIAASTLLIHEHHLADVLAGGLLAVGCLRWARRRYATADSEGLRARPQTKTPPTASAPPP
jgi:membrane-associated phospholipid phosphatase